MGPTYYPINSPLINYFFYPSPLQPGGPNYPLANGFIFFYADEDHTVQLPTYSDVFTVPVLNTNPIQLGAAGECPLFYLENRLYYIVITDSSGDQTSPVTTISHYNPANSAQVPTAGSGNLLANGQFNYPIEFWEVGNEDGTGLVISQVTNFAWAWQFLQDSETTSENYITFNSVVNEIIEGNPIFETILQTTAIMSGELTKDFRSIFGSAAFYENQVVTFSAQMRSLLSGNITVNLLLEVNYGIGSAGQPPISLTTFTVTPTREKYVYTFTIPSIIGHTITEGSYLAIRIQPGLGQSTNFGITNVLMSVGTVSDPVYVQDSYSDEVAQILGASTQIAEAGLNQNWSSYYYNDGTIFPYASTGNIRLIPDVIASPTPFAFPPFSVLCNGGSYMSNGYINGIPLSRLYGVIGNTFGGTGDLSVSSLANVVTFTSLIGGRELTAYSAGNAGAHLTVVQTQKGLNGDISAVVTGPTQITVTWVEDFAPDQTAPSGGPHGAPNGVLGNWYYLLPPNNPALITTTTNGGSGSTQAIATIDFVAPAAATYQTSHSGGVTVNFIEYASFTNNTRPATYVSGTNFTKVIFVSVDGVYTNPAITTPANNTIIVPFLSANTLQQNIVVFVNAINNPFIDTVTVNSLPAQSSYFEFSSPTINYYGWFNIDGAGVDPMVAGRTGVPIPISSAFNTTQIAEAIATATNSLAFSVPAEDDLPALVMDSLVHWYIDL